MFFYQLSSVFLYCDLATWLQYIGQNCVYTITYWNTNTYFWFPLLTVKRTDDNYFLVWHLESFKSLFWQTRSCDHNNFITVKKILNATKIPWILLNFIIIHNRYILTLPKRFSQPIKSTRVCKLSYQRLPVIGIIIYTWLQQKKVPY